MNCVEKDTENESNSKKRIRTAKQYHDIHHENVQKSPDWERLPYPATVQIFSYLCDQDRGAMSRVCHKWHNCFKNPSLWRKRHFILGSRSDNDIDFSSIFGSCLQDIVIKISHKHSIRNALKIVESLGSLTENLKNARLCHINLAFLKMNRFQKFPVQRDIIIASLINFFQIQTELKKLRLTKCNFTQSKGIELLKIVATSVGHKLQLLELSKYMHKVLHLYEMEEIQETLKKFSNLTHISVNYSYISDEVLRHWAVSLSHKLESMKISVSYRETHAHVITRGTWSELSASCPKLKVSIKIKGLSDANQIIHLMPSSVPLCTFIQKLRRSYDAPIPQLSVTMKHLVDCFHHRLERIYLYCDDVRDAALVDVLDRCSKLETFSFSGNVSLTLLNKICDLLKDSQCTLSTCILSQNETRDDETEQEIKRLLPLISALLPMKKTS